MTFNVAFMPPVAAHGPGQATSRAAARCAPRMTLLSHEKEDVVFGADDAGAMAKYKLDLEIPAALSKERRRASIQALKANASFKGFRKGTIPPFVLKDVPSFVVKECAELVINEAVEELGLTKIEGDASEAEYDSEEMIARFEVGQDFQFSCSITLQGNADFAENAVDEKQQVPGEVVTVDAASADVDA